MTEVSYGKARSQMESRYSFSYPHFSSLYTILLCIQHGIFLHRLQCQVIGLTAPLAHHAGSARCY